MLFIKINLIMKLNILQLICLINYVFTFPIFDELWETNQSEPQSNNNPIESKPKIKDEPHEEQFEERWRVEFALKGNVKVEHGPHYGAVKVEGSVKIKHEYADDLDQDNSKEAKHLSDQNNSTDQDESVDEQQNESNECEKIESDQQKRDIIQKFREIKNNYKNRKYSTYQHNQIDAKISNGLGVSRTKLYKWIKELGLKKETKSKFSEFEKRKILKQFDEIKSKCKKAKFKNISMHELDEKIAKKFGVCRRTIIEWKRKFGLSCIPKKDKFSVLAKIAIRKYAKIKRKNPKMSDCGIADMLKISISSLKKWKAQFRAENKHL